MQGNCKCKVNTKTCEITKITLADGAEWQRIPYALISNGQATAKKCHDCGVIHGGYHHVGCDIEICPRCDGQLFICGCLEQSAI